MAFHARCPICLAPPGTCIGGTARRHVDHAILLVPRAIRYSTTYCKTRPLNGHILYSAPPAGCHTWSPGHRVCIYTLFYCLLLSLLYFTLQFWYYRIIIFTLPTSVFYLSTPSLSQTHRCHRLQSAFPATLGIRLSLAIKQTSGHITSSLLISLLSSRCPAPPELSFRSITVRAARSL